MAVDSPSASGSGSGGGSGEGNGSGGGGGGSGGFSGGGKNGIDDAVASLRASLRPTYPEIDRLCSDAYLAAVLAVPDRAFEYARDEKIAKALAWRREYGVEALLKAFRCDGDAGGIFRTKTDDAATQTEQSDNDAATDEEKQSTSILFVPSTYLVDVCLSGAFAFAGFDGAGRGILHSKTALLDWWRTGAEDGIRYHVLVIEHALKMLTERNNSNHGAEKEAQSTSESMVLYVDTSDLSLIPPPLGALTGMAGLMQRAYPDRIHRIYVGPVNAFLRSLFDLVSPYLRPRSRDKVVLMENAPSREEVERMY